MKRCIGCKRVFSENQIAINGTVSVCKSCFAEWDQRNHCDKCGVELNVKTWALYKDKRCPGQFFIRNVCRRCQYKYNRKIKRTNRRKITTALKTLESVQDFIDSHGYPPTGEEIALTMGVSETTVKRHLATLVEHGYIRRTRGWRGIEIVERAETKNAA